MRSSMALSRSSPVCTLRAAARLMCQTFLPRMPALTCHSPSLPHDARSHEPAVRTLASAHLHAFTPRNSVKISYRSHLHERAEKVASTCDESRRMPVLVTKDFAPRHGGIQRCMSRLAQELARRNERVVVVAPRTAGCAEYDATQHFRTLRYPGSGRIASFAAMTLWLLAARLRAREGYTLASLWFPDGLAACLLPRPLRGKLAVLAHGSEIAPRRGGLRRRRHALRLRPRRRDRCQQPVHA